MAEEKQKPFKTVKVEYFREPDEFAARFGRKNPRVRVVTEEKTWVGSVKDPVVSTRYEYL